MNKLIVIVGVSGAGKTTLARKLMEKGEFEPALEGHEMRPFQSLFQQDSKYAFVNQMDYLLFRAEQECELRKGSHSGMVDGGLDLDFHGFTRLFHARGWLSDAEFTLCRRFYSLTRDLLPPPDLIIALTAASQTIHERLASRNRINIASSEDAEMITQFLNEWLVSLPAGKVLSFDTNHEDREFSGCMSTILDRIKNL